MLEDQIKQDYVQAMKDKDSLKSSTLSFLRAQLKNVIIEKKLEKLEDKDSISVIKKQIKQRQDSIEQFDKAARADLADKEKAELAILKSYLPEELSEADIQKVVDQAIGESKATSLKDMGAVMKIVVSQLEGRADNKLVSDLVKKSLS